MQGPLDKQHWSEARPWLKGVETFFQRFSIPGNMMLSHSQRPKFHFPRTKTDQSQFPFTTLFEFYVFNRMDRIFISCIFWKVQCSSKPQNDGFIKTWATPPAIWKNGTVKEYSGVNALNNFLIGHNALHFFPYSTQWIDDADLSFKTWNWPFKGFKTVIIGSTPAWRERSGDETKQKPKTKEKEKHNKT